MQFFLEIHTFSFKKSTWKCRLENGGHLSQPRCVKSQLSLSNTVLTRENYSLALTPWTQPHGMGHGQHPNLKMDMDGPKFQRFTTPACPYAWLALMVVLAASNHFLGSHCQQQWLPSVGPRFHDTSGLILGLCPAYERRRYFVTTSLIGWAQA